MSKTFKQHFLKIIVLILCIKTSLIFWSAHPFDFWTFVTTIQKSTLYNWNVFEYWNKGNILIALWYPLYALYLKIIEYFSLQPDNLLLLHFFFKFPFLTVDLLSGYLIYLIVEKITTNSAKAREGLLLWYLNPIIYYVYGIHGHYEILIPFSFLLLIWGILGGSPYLSGIALVIGFSTKYYFVLFMPFIIHFYILSRNIRSLIVILVVFSIGINIAYLHFYSEPAFIKQTFDAVMGLSQSNAPIGVSEIRLSPLNVFSMFHYLFDPNNPIANVNNAFIFALANKGLKLILILTTMHFVLRIYSTRKNPLYPFEVLLKDLFLIMLYLLVFLTNFQTHYLSWIVPAFIITFYLGHAIIASVFTILTVVGFLLSFKSEIGPGTFFLDIIRYPLPLFNDVSFKILYGMSALIIVLLMIAGIYLILSRKSLMPIIPTKKLFDPLSDYFPYIGALWLIAFVIYGQAIFVYLDTKIVYNDLAFSRGSNYHNGIIYANYPIAKKDNTNNKTVFFENRNQFNSLMLSQLNKLNKIDKNNFEAYILIDDQKYDKSFNPIFNGCNGSFLQKIFNFDNNQYYDGFKIDISCVQTSNNYIYWGGGERMPSEYQLYIVNKKVDYLYNPALKNKIGLLSIIGITYILMLSYIIIITIGKFAKGEEG